MNNEKAKKRIRRVTAAAAALALAVSVTFPAGTDMSGISFGNAIVASAAYSGTFGDNLTWTLDNAGTLTISGSGKMYSLLFGEVAPWYSYRESITSVVIDSRVTSIGQHAFQDCTSLESVDFGTTSQLQLIYYSAFRDCTSLTSINIPANVSNIDDYAFDGCTSLESVSFQGTSNLKRIGMGAFSDCTKLTNITIPDGVTTIKHYAFSGCTILTNINIPDSVTSIENNPFSGCTSLTSIIVDSGNQNYCSVDGVLFNKVKTTLIAYPNGKGASYDIPNGVIKIYECAFSGCSNLTSVTIPNSVQSIGYSAFSDCTSLESVTFPSSVTFIGMCAFSDCTNLTNITIPNSVESIKDDAFSGCTSLESISVDENNTNYCSDDGVLFNKNKTTLILYPAKKSGDSYTIPNGVQYIEGGAFSDCTNLTNITIPNSVESIEYYTFSGCTSLTSITIPYSVTYIGFYAFDSCTNLESIFIPAGISIGSYDVPNTATQLKYTVSGNTVKITSVTPGTGRTYVAIPETICGMPVIIDSVVNFGALTQMRYTVSDGKVTITEITLGTGQTSVDIPETLGGYPVTAVVENCRQYVGVHICTGGTATCTARAVCGLCGIAYGATDPDNHSFTNYTPDQGGLTETAYCDYGCGTTDTKDIANIHSHDHSGEWQYDETDHWKVCADEDCDEILDKAEHDFDEGVVTIKPTENVMGVKTYTCQTCGATKEEFIPELEHTHTESINYNSDETGHWHYCTKCGEQLSDTEKHTFDEGVITKEATEYEEGVKTFTCQVCGYEKTETIAKLAHTHKPSSEYKSDEKQHWHYCTECGEKLDCGNHESDGGKVTKAPTSFREGEITYSCKVCGKVLKTEIIPMTVDAVVTNAFPCSYIYSYDSSMNKITVNKTKKSGVITVKLGKKYAGKSFTLYEGKNSTKVKFTEGTLDENGCITINVENGKNYTLVINA